MFRSLLALIACGFMILLGAGTGGASDAAETMILIPAGSFTMGTDGEFQDESPAHQVVLPSYYIDRNEVTVEDYARFVKATGHSAPPDWPGSVPDPKRLRHPVVNVTWQDANAYAHWQGKRLPSEAEWEKAARGGDARLLPWGGSWDPAKSNVEGPKGDVPLKPIGSYPGGASPYGVLDMCGNAWEWTADWYAGYPGNPRPSVHYGRKYRVVRGEGAINFYNSPPLHTQSLTTRARVQPFGRYDALGFRCVRDMNASPPTHLADMGQNELGKPAPPEVESPTEVAVRYRSGIPVRLLEGRGRNRRGVATFGLPFPEGQLRDLGSIRADGPVQSRTLAKWRDGSVRWALLDMPVSVKAHGSKTLQVRWDGIGKAPKPEQAVAVREELDGVSLTTGAARIRIRKGSPRWLWMEARGESLEGPDDEVRAAPGKIGENGQLDLLTAPRPYRMQPPTMIQVEDRGPLRARVRVEGVIIDPAGRNAIRYRCRVDVTAGSPHISLLHTFTCIGPERVLGIADYSLSFHSSLATGNESKLSQTVEFGGDRGVLSSINQLDQVAAGQYLTRTASGKAGSGSRAPGWVSLGEGHSQLVAVKDFWQQYPKGLSVTPTGIKVKLWNGASPFDADQGISKSHQLTLSVGGRGEGRADALAQMEEPLFGVAPSDWYCATRSLGVLAPYSLAKYPQFETELEAGADLMARNRPYGMRHWGDNYFGGPYKGINAYQNLEYDVPYNHLMQFARTGARKYLDSAVIQARHQGDIDLKHDRGPQWKHSPRHTTTEAELGHVFLRGLVAYTWITGDPEGLENARILGDWLIEVVAKSSSQGNERQIGWSLYALTGIYEATWDDRYLAAMKANVDRLLAGQDSLGRFDIRWDNRISFFYGITLSGFVKYFEVTHDERILESVKRIATRISGFYPEYGGRTLEGLAWLYTQTGDPAVRETCRRTWESTMAWRAMDVGGMSIFTTRFLPSITPLGLQSPAEWKVPDAGPVEDGTSRQHLRAGTATMFLQPQRGQAGLELILLRHMGTSPAAIRVYDAHNQLLHEADLPATAETIDAHRLTVHGGGPVRLELKCTDARAWDIISTRALRRVFHTPDWKNLDALTPRAYFRLKNGAQQVRLILEAEGEGFKGAVLYDPKGNPVGVLEKFVDFGDTRHYQYELSVDTASPEGLWSLDLQQVTVSRAEGILPFIATNPDAYFDPLVAARPH